MTSACFGQVTLLNFAITPTGLEADHPLKRDAGAKAVVNTCPVYWPADPDAHTCFPRVEIISLKILAWGAELLILNLLRVCFRF